MWCSVAPPRKNTGSAHWTAHRSCDRQCEAACHTRHLFYIPMKTNFKKFLHLPGFLAALEETQQKQSGDADLDTLRDFYDGSYAKQHPVFSKDEKWVAIGLYRDGMETVNLLGSHATVHEHGIFLLQYAEFTTKVQRETSSLLSSAGIFLRRQKDLWHKQAFSQFCTGNERAWNWWYWPHCRQYSCKCESFPLLNFWR